MPLLEFTQTRYANVSLKFSETTAQRINRYVAFIKAKAGVQIEADDAVEKNLHLGFDKDREFVEFEKSAEAKNVPAVLRVRKAPASVPSPAPSKLVPKPAETPAAAAGSKA
jgi:hypothetical protein